MSYLCLNLSGGKVSGTEVLDYTTCPIGSWVGLPLVDVATHTATNMQTLFDSYFAFDPVIAELLVTAYLVFFVTGYGTGMVVKGMRRV